MKKQLANLVTIVRITLSLPLILCLSLSKYFLKALRFEDSYVAFCVAAAFFVTASLSDYLDGYFARRYKSITKFGEILDPIADKLVINIFLFGLSHLEVLSFWMMALFFLRDVIVDAVRMLKIGQLTNVSANNWGKTKTALQTIGIVCVIAFLLITTKRFEELINFRSTELFWIANAFLYPALIVSWISGTIYLWKWSK